MTTRLANPLVVVDDITTCDRADHDIRVITEGNIAYAYGLGHGGVDAGTGSRDGTEVRFACQQPHHGQPCDGEVVVRLTDNDVWTGDPTTITLLAVHGTKIDR